MTEPWKPINPKIPPVLVSTAHTPRSRGMSACVLGKPLKTVSRTFESLMNAMFPANKSTRVIPGGIGIVSRSPVSESTVHRALRPDSSTQNLPLCQRGE